MTRGWLAVVVAPAVLAVACGVPTDHQPRPIPADRVPFGLLDREPTPSTPARAPAGATGTTVFLVANERLVPAVRDIAGPVSPEKALQALLAGVTAQEAATGVRTAIGPGTGATTTAVAGSEVRVDLTRAFLTGGTKDQILAVAQIVYTLTEPPGLDSVAFTLAGRAVEVPSADGTVRDGPLQRGDFASVAQL